MWNNLNKAKAEADLAGDLLWLLTENKVKYFLIYIYLFSKNTNRLGIADQSTHVFVYVLNARKQITPAPCFVFCEQYMTLDAPYIKNPPYRHETGTHSSHLRLATKRLQLGRAANILKVIVHLYSSSLFLYQISMLTRFLRIYGNIL